MAEDDEGQLQEQLIAVSKQFAHLLHELAALKLEKGKTEEAQKLLSQLAVLRQTPWLDAKEQPQSNVSLQGDSHASDSAQQPEPQSLPSPTADSTLSGTTISAATPTKLAAITAPQQTLKPSSSIKTEVVEPTLEAPLGGPQEPELQPANSADWEDKDWEAAAIQLPAPSVPPLPSTATLQAASQPHISFDWGPSPSSVSSTSAPSASPSVAKQRRSGSTGQLSGSQSSKVDDSLTGNVTWEGGFDHCVEVYNLTADIKTSHLQTFLDDVLPNVKLQPLIRWADDNHAVLVCPDTTTAELLLESGEEFGYSLRPFSHATQQSKMLPVSELLPPKARPKTTAAVAKRLLSHALGMPGLRDRQGEQQLADARRAAREERAARRQAASSTWGDEAE